MSSIKTSELRGQSKQELEGQLASLREELVKLRIKQETVAAGKIWRVRKSIARILTLINFSQREAVAKHDLTSKYQAKNLRAKKTRAIRRRLLPEEANAKTIKAQKKAVNFPKRKYALKA